MDEVIKCGLDPAYDQLRPQTPMRAMREEVDAILDTPIFRRSPIIARLLRFLQQETLADRSGQLKSYIVAVDGLGRPADHDIGDSYARVQMGRLRKMLQSHYSEHGPVEELCLYLQPGSYTLRTAPLATAYPNLYRPSSVLQTALTQPPVETGKPASASGNGTDIAAPTVDARMARWWVFLAMMVAIVTLLAILLTWQTNQKALAYRPSPVLELMPIETAGNPQAAELARVVSASFKDGLARFKISRIRVLQGNAPLVATDGENPVYRMQFQIEADGADKYILFLRLTDMRSNTLIWSRDARIPGQTMAVHDSIAPLIAEINGPHGVIATHGAMLYKDVDSGGYPCLLRYFTFLKTRDRESEKHIEACFEKPVAERRLRATVLASRSFFALESDAGLQNHKAALAKARGFANLALAADANDGSARYAMARIAYLDGDCISARFYTQQTVEANPYSPVFMSMLAGHAPQCPYDGVGDLLDKAFLVANPADPDTRLLLVLAAVAQRRTDRLAQIEQTNVPRNGRHKVNYYLSETLIAASKGSKAESAEYWQKFSKASPSSDISPDGKLRAVILSPRLRQQVIGYLARRNVFDRPNGSISLKAACHTTDCADAEVVNRHNFMTWAV